jgi:hypothetical protein
MVYGGNWIWTNATIDNRRETRRTPVLCSYFFHVSSRGACAFRFPRPRAVVRIEIDARRDDTGPIAHRSTHTSAIRDHGHADAPPTCCCVFAADAAHRPQRIASAFSYVRARLHTH